MPTVNVPAGIKLVPDDEVRVKVSNAVLDGELWFGIYPAVPPPDPAPPPPEPEPEDP